MEKLVKTVEEKLAQARARGKPGKTCDLTVTPARVFLPGFALGAMPNHLNRSSLFAPIACGRREFHHQTVMVTRCDCILEHTGEQLDEADADLIMALIYFGSKQPLGTIVPLHRKKLLRKIKTGVIGSTQYDWLHKSMKRLREATLFLEARKPDGSTKYRVGKMTSFNILKELEYGETSEEYSYMLDPRWLVLFGNKEYSLIDFEKRLRIGRGQSMAKTLQRRVATSANPVQYYSLDDLKVAMQYSGRVWDFRNAVQRAVDELKRVNIIGHSKIGKSTKGKEQLTIWLQAVA